MSHPSQSSRTPRGHRNTTSSITKTPVHINIYDLLPPGRLSSTLWTLGASLLHTGVVIKDREYAFGGHNRNGVTGVYWTKPKTEPPGGTWRQEILHGFTYASPEEIEEIIRDASKEFTGPSYNLLTRNCNHFTSHLCKALTGQPAPNWINRAASIGVALPCVVPQGWVEPPECELEDQGEEARLTGRRSMERDDAWDESEYEEEDDDDLHHHPGQRKDDWGTRQLGDVKDTQGREIPSAERARMDRTVT
ncbi:PPPDE putative peptidase domain-containing protein [Geopyxis carbonaria]|nr:PPPDE putative peptidase domain-containing protein [Geopyxis carbonaria]